MEKVVVTGGAGFIGSHLAEELIRKGYFVTILDDLSTGKLENIDGLLKQGRTEFIRGSVIDLDLLKKAFKDTIYVFHLAAIARVPQSVADPLTTNEVNITGTLNVLLAARDNGVKKVINSSSSAVYGDTEIMPQSEDIPPNPLSPYALTKLIGEYYGNVFSRIYNLPTVSLRYFNVFGPRQDPLSPYSNVIPLFINRISQGQHPVIYDDGEQSRDYIYIDDIVKANILATGPGVEGAYNIGSGTATTVNKLLKTILKIMEKEIEPVYEEPRAGDPRHTLADITRASRFGFKSKLSLEEGLKAIIPYYSS